METSCKFDFAATNEAIGFIRSFLQQDEVFEKVNLIKKTRGLDWYHALAAFLLLLRDDEHDELHVGVRRLYALIFAGCAAKAGEGGSSPTEALANSYEEFGLDRSEIE